MNWHYTGLLPYRGLRVCPDTVGEHLWKGSCQLTGTVPQDLWPDVVRTSTFLDVHRSQQALYLLLGHLHRCYSLVTSLLQL